MAGVCASVAWAGIANAQDYEAPIIYDGTYEEVADPAPDPYSYAWRDPRLRTQIGVGLIVGGGVMGFTDPAMRASTNDLGGLWDARLSIGTHTPIGLDLSYTGVAASLQSFNAVDNGTLVGTSLEAALRYNVLPHAMVTPYLFGGIGWQRYDVDDPNVAQSVSGLSNEDNLAVFPMGVGMALRAPSGLVVDVRGTFRAATDSGLLSLPEGTDENAELHTWEARAALGYEF